MADEYERCIFKDGKYILGGHEISPEAMADHYNAAHANMRDFMTEFMDLQRRVLVAVGLDVNEVMEAMLQTYNRCWPEPLTNSKNNDIIDSSGVGTTDTEDI